jgi:RNA polymerase sigma factor (sigma-70 family)
VLPQEARIGDADERAGDPKMPRSKTSDKTACETLKTRTELVEGLKCDRNTYWEPFFQRYGRKVIGLCLKSGFSRDQAEEIAQRSIVTFQQHLKTGRFDAKKSLRKYLFGIVRRKMLQMRAEVAREQRNRKAFLRQVSITKVVTDEGGLTRLWKSEWEEAVLKRCYRVIRQKVKPETWRVFELHVVRGWPAERVGRHFGIPTAQVHRIKHRLLEILKRERTRLIRIY